MKTFLSIGAGPGMGIATAERFAAEGFQVVLVSRNAEKTRKSKGYTAEVGTADAGDPESVGRLVVNVEKEYGAIDVLHYNAGVLRKATLAEQPRDTFVSDLAVNVGGALVAAQAVAGRMEERKSGAILLTGGGFALAPSPDFLSLSIGKAGIRAMALGLFEPFRAKGIHVATVTVLALVAPDSKEAEAVAEHFWRLYSQPKDAWTAEVRYSSASA
jgi:NAD(P)-dependent dehydrogenase (short-subunit alcohol dehydrogenase family)